MFTLSYVTFVLKFTISTLGLSPDSLTVFCVLPILKCGQSPSPEDSLHRGSSVFLPPEAIDWKTLATLSLSSTWLIVLRASLCFFLQIEVNYHYQLENTGNTITITDWLNALVKHKIRLGLVVGSFQIWTKRLIKEIRLCLSDFVFVCQIAFIFPWFVLVVCSSIYVFWLCVS